jgi:hypothetical protein
MEAAGEVSRRGRAFGLDLDVWFDCPGLPPAPSGLAPGARSVRVELTSEPLAATFPSAAARLWELESPEGTLYAHFDADPAAGYLLTATGYGSFVIGPEGTRVLCAPESDAEPAWRWQRYLVGQVLPFVAVLHRMEVFHASVMVVGDIAVAFLGASGAGKSSIAAACALRGARYLADDVMAVEGDRGREPEVYAHPGFGLASLRRDLAQRLDRDALARLGTPVGEDEDALRLEIDVAPNPVPIACAYFLDRRDDGAAAAIEACNPVEPRLLLASSYNFVLRDPDRLTRQLDVCAHMAHRIPMFRLPVVPGMGPFQVAERVHHHVASIAA